MWCGWSKKYLESSTFFAFKHALNESSLWFPYVSVGGLRSSIRDLRIDEIKQKNRAFYSWDEIYSWGLHKVETQLFCLSFGKIWLEKQTSEHTDTYNICVLMRIKSGPLKCIFAKIIYNCTMKLNLRLRKKILSAFPFYLKCKMFEFALCILAFSIITECK